MAPSRLSQPIAGFGRVRPLAFAAPPMVRCPAVSSPTRPRAQQETGLKRRRPSPAALAFLGILAVSGALLAAVVPVDRAWTAALAATPHPSFTDFMRRTLFQGDWPGASDPPVLLLLALFAAYLAAQRARAPAWLRRWRPQMGFLVVSALGAGLGVVHSLKWLTGRARPKYVLDGRLPYSDWFEPGPLTLADGIYRGSFPSGHTAAVFLFMALAYMLAGNPAAPAARRALGVAAGALALALAGAMTLANAMEGMHWVSDAVGSVGLVWLVIHALYYWVLQVPRQEARPAPPGQRPTAGDYWELVFCWWGFVTLLGVVLAGLGLRALATLPWPAALAVAAGGLGLAVWGAPRWRRSYAVFQARLAGTARVAAPPLAWVGGGTRPPRPGAAGGFRRIVRVLVVHSAGELVRYKSFLLLIGLMILLERGVQRLRPEVRGLELPPLSALGPALSHWVYTVLPGQAWGLLTDPRTVAVLALLFLVKQVISLWPSSDMRRMHRYERERMGIFRSLLLLRWDQVAWDAIAVSTLAGGGALWVAAVVALTGALWHWSGWDAWVAVAGAAVALSFPILMAGLSYSSKLAVISGGRFGERLGLFYRLFTDWRLFWQSWVLFALRILIEGAFVAVVPVVVFAQVETYWVRIGLASLFAVPAYSYVKMASFKFFLEVYRPFPAVQQEYARYFRTGPA